MIGFYLHVLYNEVLIITFFKKNMSTVHQIIATTILFVKLMLILKSSFHLYHCTGGL